MQLSRVLEYLPIDTERELQLVPRAERAGTLNPSGRPICQTWRSRARSVEIHFLSLSVSRSIIRNEILLTQNAVSLVATRVVQTLEALAKVVGNVSDLKSLATSVERPTASRSNLRQAGPFYAENVSARAGPLNRELNVRQGPKSGSIKRVTDITPVGGVLSARGLSSHELRNN